MGKISMKMRLNFKKAKTLVVEPPDSTAKGRLRHPNDIHLNRGSIAMNPDWNLWIFGSRLTRPTKLDQVAANPLFNKLCNWSRGILLHISDWPPSGLDPLQSNIETGMRGVAVGVTCYLVDFSPSLNSPKSNSAGNPRPRRPIGSSAVAGVHGRRGQKRHRSCSLRSACADWPMSGALRYRWYIGLRVP